MLEKFLKGYEGRTPAEQPYTKEDAAKLLQMSPEALQAFEAAYRKDILDAEVDTGSLFDVSAAQVKPEKDLSAVTAESRALNRRIVRELLAQSAFMAYGPGSLESGLCLDLSREQSRQKEQGMRPCSSEPVTRQEILAMPEAMRPQLSGSLMKKDIGEDSYLALLMYYERMTDQTLTKKQRQDSYHQFRQGLDILDLDSVTYAILGTNKNAMSHWLPSLAHAVITADMAGWGFFKIPRTRIVKIPMPLLQLSRLDYGLLTQATMEIVDDFCFQAFDLKEDGDYFVKTGTYSSKFNFRNAHVTGPKEVRELGEYLLFIQHQAVTMAGPLTQPSIYGMSTTNEWVVREFIPDPENNPTIYKGLPLRTEYRVFIDLDAGTVLGIAPYWNPDIMKKRFGHEPDADSPHQIHDYITYSAAEPTLMARYESNKERVVAELTRLLPDMSATGLTGQWSLDIMQSGDDFWLIDMALACTSALADCIPAGMLRAEPEISLPRLIAPAADVSKEKRESWDETCSAASGNDELIEKGGEMSTEEAIKHLEQYVDNECYTAKHQEVCRMAIAALRAQQAKLDRSRWKECRHCQKGIFYGNKFCRYCGRPLTEEAWTELERRIMRNESD